MNSKFGSVQRITRGPKHHWFGYYDKLQFDPEGRFVLGMEVDFQHRSPLPEDIIKVGMVDLADDNRWIELAETRAWCWQQGCMLQWRPGSNSEILWNDREGDTFVCRILDVVTREIRTIPQAVYSVSPDGRYGISPDFRRINDTRPGYGYAGSDDPYRNELIPESSGVHRVDLETGEAAFLFSIKDAVQIPGNSAPPENAKHYINHLLFNPDGSRFVFLHRYKLPGESRGFYTRAITAGVDGADFCVLNDTGLWSHFIWRDNRHILAWSRHPSGDDGMYLYNDRTDSIELLGEGAIDSDSHISYLPGNRWLVGDAYPSPERKQPLFLFDTESGESETIGQFYLPEEYTGEWRCDLHPRFSRDGRYLCIDSAHDSSGRQMYLIDIGIDGENQRRIGNRPEEQENNPLHGVTLEQIVTRLVGAYGWHELGRKIKIKCFTHDPSIRSSLKFLRKTPWARAKVESLYIDARRIGEI